MPKKKTDRLRPALSPEAQESRMISLAMDLAEKKLRDGTASSQLVLHFAKKGSIKERLEIDILEEQKKLVAAKTQNLESQQRMDEVYQDALKAFRGYSGQEDMEDEDDY